MKRDSKGHSARPNAKAEFMKPFGYPHGRRGYGVDHIVPRKRDLADSPSDMQWQAKVTAKAKAKIE